MGQWPIPGVLASSHPGVLFPLGFPIPRLSAARLFSHPWVWWQGPIMECETVLSLALIPLMELWQNHLHQSYGWRFVRPVPVGPGWAPVSRS